MAKAKKLKSAPLSVEAEFNKQYGASVKEVMDEITKPDRPYVVTEATLKDGYCHYSILIIEGTGEGNTMKIKGTHVVTDDLTNAFDKLRTHLAYVDDIYKHNKVKIEDIDKHYLDEFSELYTVHGFKMGGNDEAETVYLRGNKYLSQCGNVSFDTGAIALDFNSSYKWYNELDAQIRLCRNEVSLYHEGKYILDQNEDDDDSDQAEIDFPEDDDDDFEYNKI